MKEQLPTGWIQTRLGEVCLPVSKHQPNNQPDKEITYLDIGGIDSQTHSISEIKRYLGAEAPSRARQLVQTGDTLFSTVRVYLEKIALVPDPLDGSTASTGFCVLRPSGVINPRFLYFRVLEHRFIEELSTKQTGTSYPAVRDQDIFAMNIHLPPLAEQRKITDAIEEHFSRIDAAESAAQTALAKLDTLRRTVLTAAFSGRLVDQDPDDEPASVLPERIAAELPKSLTPCSFGSEWTVAKLEHLLDHSIGGIWGSKSGTDEMDVDVIRVTELTPDGGLNTQTAARRSITCKQYSSRLLKKGDILLEKSGGGPTTPVGRVAFFNYHPRPAICTNFMQLMRPNSTIIRSKFLFWQLHSWHAQGKTARLQKGSSNIRNLQTKQYLSETISYPDLATQDQIVTFIEEHFSRIDAAKALLERCLQRCGVLRRSVLAAAFSGRLVEQDPNDESASVLLERIATEQPKRRTRRKSA